MAESVQNWLERNRPPQAKITYDVETGGAIEKRELPFIVGVFADLSGERDPEQEITPYQQRQMVAIDRDLFNDVMKALSPRVALGHIARIPSAPGALGATAFATAETLTKAKARRHSSVVKQRSCQKIISPPALTLTPGYLHSSLTCWPLRVSCITSRS